MIAAPCDPSFLRVFRSLVVPLVLWSIAVITTTFMPSFKPSSAMMIHLHRIVSNKYDAEHRERASRNATVGLEGIPSGMIVHLDIPLRQTSCGFSATRTASCCVSATRTRTTVHSDSSPIVSGDVAENRQSSIVRKHAMAASSPACRHILHATSKKQSDPGEGFPPSASLRRSGYEKIRPEIEPGLNRV